MITTFYDGHDVLYHHAKFGEMEQRVPAVGAKMCCLYIFCLSRSESGGPFVRAYFEQVLCDGLWVDFDSVSPFSEVIALSGVLEGSYLYR